MYTYIYIYIYDKWFPKVVLGQMVSDNVSGTHGVYIYIVIDLNRAL